MAPNAAATASVHPVKQGLIQTFLAFLHTLIICTCTYLLFYLVKRIHGTLDGVKLTQAALNSEIGSAGSYYVAAIFAFSSILGNHYYGEAKPSAYHNTRKQWVIPVYRILVTAMVLFGSLASLKLVWEWQIS